jgi:hypothetical protein
MAVIEFLLFSISSGLFFNERFRKNWAAVTVAGTIATISFFFFYYQVQDLLSGRTTLTSMSQVGGATPSDVRPDRSILNPSPKAIELTFWQSAMQSNDIISYQAYLKKYPDGDFSEIARARIRELRAIGERPRVSPPSGQPDQPDSKQQTPSSNPGGNSQPAPVAGDTTDQQTPPQQPTKPKCVRFNNQLICG